MILFGIFIWAIFAGHPFVAAALLVRWALK